MALTQVRNRVYARITDLSEESYLTDGDKLIFHCDATGSASIIDWTNFKVDLDHVTFGASFTEVLTFVQTAQAFFSAWNEEYTELQQSITESTNTVNDIINEIKVIKLILKLMLGEVNGKGASGLQSFLNSELSDITLEKYNNIIGSIRANYEFDERNFLNFKKASDEASSTTIENYSKDIVDSITASQGLQQDVMDKVNQLLQKEIDKK